MANTFDYVISGGAKGKSRLNLLASVLEPYTKELLASLGVKDGVSFLDNGCGGGNVSVMVGKMAGEKGRIMAIDFDEEILGLAKNDAENEGLRNISFRSLSAYELPFENEFDFAYARFLLSHLGNPFTALQKMVESVKPGGTIIVEDVHFSGHFSYPVNEAFNQYVRWYTEVVKQKGADAETGSKVFSLFKEAGIKDVGFNVIQPVFHTGDGKWMAYVTLDRIKDTLIQTGIATADDISHILKELEIFTRDENTIISLPRIFRVWGKKQVV